MLGKGAGVKVAALISIGEVGRIAANVGAGVVELAQAVNVDATIERIK